MDTTSTVRQRHSDTGRRTQPGGAWSCCVGFDRYKYLPKKDQKALEVGHSPNRPHASAKSPEQS